MAQHIYCVFLKERQGKRGKQLRIDLFEYNIGTLEHSCHSLSGNWPWSFRAEECCLLEFRSQREVVSLNMKSEVLEKLPSPGRGSVSPVSKAPDARPQKFKNI